MSEFISLKPRKTRYVMDLVREAGVDVSDWVNFKGGVRRAKSNPKYCYNWSFTDKDVVVLNLWYGQMQEESDTISVTSNMRLTSESNSTKDVWKKRAKEFDKAIQLAYQNKILLRVILNDGDRRQGNSKTTKASKVNFRMLDPKSWLVSSYDFNSGEYVLSREIPNVQIVDQFRIEHNKNNQVERYSISGEVFKRSGLVRQLVLERAKGKCEYCGIEGFYTKEGSLYLETHHVIPLSKGGDDNVFNVVALCPNHHREAHYGAAPNLIQSTLLKKWDCNI